VVAGVGFLFVLSLIIIGSTSLLMFRRFVRTAITTIRVEPWNCMGLGLAVCATTPVVIRALFFTVIGWLPATVICALNLISLIAGFLTGVFYAGDIGRGLLKRSEAFKLGQLWSFAVTSLAVVLLEFVPVLGMLLLFAIMLVGVGALQLGLYRNYMQQPDSAS
jgi:hypothetical protein